MTCIFDGCNEPGEAVSVRVNTYTDHTHTTRVRLTMTVPLCTTHRFIHGYAWAPRHSAFAGEFPPDYKLYHGKRVGPL